MIFTTNTVLFIMIFEIAISWRFQAVSAGDRDPTMDYLNHTCGVAFRYVSDLGSPPPSPKGPRMRFPYSSEFCGIYCYPNMEVMNYHI